MTSYAPTGSGSQYGSTRPTSRSKVSFEDGGYSEVGSYPAEGGYSEQDYYQPSEYGANGPSGKKPTFSQWPPTKRITAAEEIEFQSDSQYQEAPDGGGNYDAGGSSSAYSLEFSESLFTNASLSKQPGYSRTPTAPATRRMTRYTVQPQLVSRPKTPSRVKTLTPVTVKHLNGKSGKSYLVEPHAIQMVDEPLTRKFSTKQKYLGTIDEFDQDQQVYEEQAPQITKLVIQKTRKPSTRSIKQSSSPSPPRKHCCSSKQNLLPCLPICPQICLPVMQTAAIPCTMSTPQIVQNCLPRPDYSDQYCQTVMVPMQCCIQMDNSSTNGFQPTQSYCEPPPPQLYGITNNIQYQTQNYYQQRPRMYQMRSNVQHQTPNYYQHQQHQPQHLNGFKNYFQQQCQNMQFPQQNRRPQMGQFCESIKMARYNFGQRPGFGVPQQSSNCFHY